MESDCMFNQPSLEDLLIILYGQNLKEVVKVNLKGNYHNITGVTYSSKNGLSIDAGDSPEGTVLLDLYRQLHKENLNEVVRVRIDNLSYKISGITYSSQTGLSIDID